MRQPGSKAPIYLYSGFTWFKRLVTTSHILRHTLAIFSCWLTMATSKLIIVILILHSACAASSLLKISSSLKEKARKSSRSFSSPLTRIQTTEVQDKMSLTDPSDPLHLKSSVESPLSFSDFVKTCNDKNVLQNFCLALKQEVAENEEKLGKLERIEHYHSKKKPEELIGLTEKWLTVSQESLRKLYEKLPENKGNFQDFLNMLNVDCNIINYEPDTDTFSH